MPDSRTYFNKFPGHFQVTGEAANKLDTLVERIRQSRREHGERVTSHNASKAHILSEWILQVLSDQTTPTDFAESDRG